MSQQTFDDTIRKTHRTTDEKAWERQQRRKHRTAPESLIPETGPACARCGAWRAPSKPDGFGTCRVLANVKDGRNRGLVLAVADVHKHDIGDWEYLHTKAGFQCSLFAHQTKSLTTETSP